jgi:hypothetical protein
MTRQQLARISGPAARRLDSAHLVPFKSWVVSMISFGPVRSEMNRTAILKCSPALTMFGPDDHLGS